MEQKGTAEGDRMKKRSGTVTACAFAIVIILAGCTHARKTNEISETTGKLADTSEQEARNVSSLLGREWILESLGPSGSGESIGDVARITIVFIEDGRFHGSAGCNQYFGSFEVGADGSLSTGKVGSTMMMCPDEIMGWESRYLQALEDISSYRINNRYLMLFSEGEEKVLTFIENALNP